MCNVHPPKTNMDPKNDSLEEGLPFNYGNFGLSMLVFGGVHEAKLVNQSKNLRKKNI